MNSNVFFYETDALEQPRQKFFDAKEEAEFLFAQGLSLSEIKAKVLLLIQDL